MSNERVIGLSLVPEDTAPTIGLELFPVMAVLLAQVLDLDQPNAVEGSSR
jgi:hypothetical protein